MTHTIDIIWHNLIEDPNDLPNKTDIYWCMLADRKTGKIYPFWSCSYFETPDTMYRPDLDLWESRYNDEHDGFMKSYGHAYNKERIMNLMGCEHAEDMISKDCIVVAWAEHPKVFQLPVDHIDINNQEV